MRKALFILFPLLLLGFGYSFCTQKTVKTAKVTEATSERLRQEVQNSKTFIAQHPKYNQEIAFFIDMKVMSGKNRFFVYDFKKKEVVDKGLVAHGSGSETGVSGQLSFSNIPNSNATSLGKYAINEKYSGRFGTAYRLTGLDKTNSNARSRSIVLHHYNDVPYEEQPNPIVNSLGCPMVNKAYFERLEQRIDKASKTMLLTIYY